MGELKYIEEIIAEVAKSYGLINWCFTVKKFEVKGQNYFGELIPVSLQGQKDLSKVNLDVVLKLAPTVEELRVSGALTRFFAKEIYVYTNVVSQYAELQKRLSEIDFVAPICYFVRKEFCGEVIALQNMQTASYKPYLKQFDMSHIKVSLKALAQFHALFFILRSKDKEKYQEINENCPPLSENNNKRFMDILKDRLDKGLDKFKNTEYEGLFKNLLMNYVELIEIMATSVSATCLCHADMWRENILFKYQEDKAISACLIDYQTARLSSPAFDVLYIIATNTSSAFRKDNFSHLIETYYEAFDKNITEAGLISKEIYSKEMLNHDLTKVGPGVLIVANTAIWLSSGLQREGIIQSKTVLKTQEERQQAVNNYKEMISGIIEDFDKYGYLDLVTKLAESNKIV